MKIALIAGSFKPYTKGHAGLVNLASNECDVVHLYVSVSDRARTGEVPVLGTDMARLWKVTIEPSLPENVQVTYGGSPIGNVWKELGKANESQSTDTYVLYGDPEDLAQNFTENLLQKYCGGIFTEGQVILRAVERSSTADVSGTLMRDWLKTGDKQSFINNLPNDIDRELVWNTLSKTAQAPPKVKATAGPKHKKPAVAKKTQSEALLRSYVRIVLGRK